MHTQRTHATFTLFLPFSSNTPSHIFIQRFIFDFKFKSDHVKETTNKERWASLMEPAATTTANNDVTEP